MLVPSLKAKKVQKKTTKKVLFFFFILDDKSVDTGQNEDKKSCATFGCQTLEDHVHIILINYSCG